MTLWRTCSSATLGDGERSHPVVLSPTDLTSPSNARAQAIASLSDLNSKRHVTVASSVLHRKASGSKRWASSHSRIRAIIVDNSSCPRRISTTYNMPLLYSGTSLRRVNAGTEITAGRVLSARANPPVLWALAVLRPHYGPDREPSAGIQVSMLAVLTLLAPNICSAVLASCAGAVARLTPNRPLRG
jgi:hypothetical protein